MSFHLTDTVKSVFNGEVTHKLAEILDETNVQVEQTVQVAVPAVLAGIIMKADSGEVQDTMNLATDASKIEDVFQLNASFAGSGNPKGIDFLKNIFGEKTNSLSESIASFSGIRVSSADAILSTAMPAALCVLGKHILDTNMNASGLKSFLNSQKKKIFNVLPSGIFLEGIMGLDNLSGLSEKFSTTEQITAPKKSRLKWILPLVSGIIVIAALWFYLNKPASAEPKPPVVEDVTKPVPDTMTAGPVLVKPYSIKLPDGVVLSAKKGGLEDQLVNFFNDPNSHPSRRFPFSFDQLSFNNETAVISNESMVQIQNVASILKAYPNAKIKIGGFNDKSGDSGLKKNLSESRAAAVSTALKAAGTNPAQITGVEGFGSDFAKYPADAPDSSREKDRRISISIRGK